MIGVNAYGNIEAELGEILEKLKDDNEIEAYGQTGNTTITGITFGPIIEQNGIEIEIGEVKAVDKIATFTSSEPSQDYYVQIRGKKYSIAKINGEIKINKTQITTGTNAKGKITEVFSDKESVATVEKVTQPEGTTDKIKITGIAKGTTTITVKYTETIKTSFNVTVKGNVEVTVQMENITDDKIVGTVKTLANGTNKAIYAEGSIIELTATITDKEYQFVGWYEKKEGGTETQKSTSPAYSYIVPSDTTTILINAKFEKVEPLIGYYIKKGDEYAIVFADRLAQAGVTVTWSSTNSSTCTFPTLSDWEKRRFKTYEISNETYTDSKFGTHKVIKVAEDNTGTEERFMAMSLKHVDNKIHCWYSSADNSNSYSTVTYEGFNTGRTNTGTMITKWNNEQFGTKNGNSSYPDLWGVVQTKYGQGWFVPSKSEWVAFVVYMKNYQGLTTENYSSKFGLASFYWSSSQRAGYRSAWAPVVGNKKMQYCQDYYLSKIVAVRLATTY